MLYMYIQVPLFSPLPFFVCLVLLLLLLVLVLILLMPICLYAAFTLSLLKMVMNVAVAVDDELSY